MALTRVWTPSGNYSGGSTKRLIVIHTMEGFTGSNGAYDCAKYFQTDCGASSHVCIDNNRGKVWECVSRGNGAWTQCNYNSVSVSAEQSGYASWSRDYWLNNRSNQLHNMADWIAEESKKLSIPITDLSSSQAQGGSWGVCYHSELGSSGCGHSDPGAGFPLDKVLEWARGGTTTPPPVEEEEEEDDMGTFCFIPPFDGKDVGVSLDKYYTHVGFCCDPGRVGGGTVSVRVAWHIVGTGPNQFRTQTINLDTDNPKGHVNFTGGNVDGCSFLRNDELPITLFPNFGM